MYIAIWAARFGLTAATSVVLAWAQPPEHWKGSGRWALPKSAEDYNARAAMGNPGWDWTDVLIFCAERDLQPATNNSIRGINQMGVPTSHLLLPRCQRHPTRSLARIGYEAVSSARSNYLIPTPPCCQASKQTYAVEYLHVRSQPHRPPLHRDLRSRRRLPEIGPKALRDIPVVANLPGVGANPRTTPPPPSPTLHTFNTTKSTEHLGVYLSKKQGPYTNALAFCHHQSHRGACPAPTSTPTPSPTTRKSAKVILGMWGSPPPGGITLALLHAPRHGLITYLHQSSEAAAFISSSPADRCL